jgi:hypothetical protein
MEKIIDFVLRVAIIAIPIGIVLFVWACVFYVISHI